MSEDRPIDIVQGKTGLWDPSFRILTITKDPLTTSHELAHARLGHTSSMGSILGDLVEEKEAWKEALRRIDPEEIRIVDIKNNLASYLEQVDKYYGSSSPQHEMGVKIINEVVEYARKRKKEVG